MLRLSVAVDKLVAVTLDSIFMTARATVVTVMFVLAVLVTEAASPTSACAVALNSAEPLSAESIELSAVDTPERLPEATRAAESGVSDVRAVCADADAVRLVLTAANATVVAVVLADADTNADTAQDPEMLAVSAADAEIPDATSDKAVGNAVKLTAELSCACTVTSASSLAVKADCVNGTAVRSPLTLAVASTAEVEFTFAEISRSAVSAVCVFVSASKTVCAGTDVCTFA